MKKLFLILLVIAASVNYVFSQFKPATFFSVEGSVNTDIFNLYDPCQVIKDDNILQSVYLGFTLGQEIRPNWVLESGLIIKNYSFRYKNDVASPTRYGAQVGAFNSLQLPLRLKTSTKLIRERLYFTTIVGYHLGINTSYDDEFDQSQRDEPSPIPVGYINEESYRKVFSLIETGIGLDYVLTDYLNLSVSGNLFTGLSKVHQIQLNTFNDDCNSTEAFLETNGSYWSLALALRWKISHLWQRG